LRPGRDILFLVTLMHYVLESEKDLREYVIHYHNMRMHPLLSVPEGDVGDQRNQFYLFGLHAGESLLFCHPVELT
jgi:hypothetical protein